MDVEVELGNEMETGPESANKWATAYKMFGMDPLIDRAYLLEKNLRALGEKRPKRGMVNPATAQSDALQENGQVMAMGILSDPRPADNHQTHVQIHMMMMQTPQFQAMAQAQPQWAAELQKHIGRHMEYVQMMEQVNGQAQQTGTTPPPQGGTTVPEANERANAMFDMGQRGREQMGAQ